MGQLDQINDIGAAAAAPQLKKYEPRAETNPEDDKKAWALVRDETDSSFGEVVVENVDLPCGIDEFFDAFLRDEAEYPLSAYQRDVIGDDELEVSPWVAAPGGADAHAPPPSPSPSPPCLSLSRTIEYRHPVSAGPMAPPSARATREQTLRMYGSRGLVLDTRIAVRGVPISDCFRVEDRLLLEPSPNGGSALTVRFDVRFVKRTVFKKMVKVAAGEEVRRFWMGYVPYVRRALGSLVREEASLLDGFLEGMGCPPMLTARSLGGCKETLEGMAAPLTQALGEMTAPLLDACGAVVHTDGVGDTAETGATAAESTLRHRPQEHQHRGVDSDSNHARGEVELTYLPGLGRELADAGGSSYDEGACRRLIRGAIARKFQAAGERPVWEFLSERVFASPEGRLEVVDGDLVGYSAFEDAVVAAMLSSWGKGDGDRTGDGRLPSTEVALIEDERQIRPLFVI